MLSTLKELTIQLERENGNQATLIYGPTVFGKYFRVGKGGGVQGCIEQDLQRVLGRGGASV